MKAKVLAGLSVLLISGASYAACPENLNAENMADCLRIEKAGGNYQEEMQKAESKDMVSPATGADVRTVKPAAGGTDAKTDAKTQ